MVGCGQDKGKHKGKFFFSLIKNRLNRFFLGALKTNEKDNGAGGKMRCGGFGGFFGKGLFWEPFSDIWKMLESFHL